MYSGGIGGGNKRTVSQVRRRPGTLLNKQQGITTETSIVGSSKNYTRAVHVHERKGKNKQSTGAFISSSVNFFGQAKTALPPNV